MPMTEDPDMTYDINEITRQMVMEHLANETELVKELRQRLTKEFVGLRSMAKLMESNPDVPKETAKRHARTSLRLPDELRKMENEGDLHPDPECSLQIALYAVNYFDWDGGTENKDEVIHMAQSIAGCLQRSDELSSMVRKRYDLEADSTGFLPMLLLSPVPVFKGAGFWAGDLPIDRRSWVPQTAIRMNGVLVCP